MLVDSRHAFIKYKASIIHNEHSQSNRMRRLMILKNLKKKTSGFLLNPMAWVGAYRWHGKAG
ncbi:hypothetical protein BKE30_07275 [Alkanindiges hydrocarboniclasticus]|uniref:Uncharacterized protein n=1 Tax=Alkanindiges hydrocarboniclasticus TaxID=1907941 RepID=A0A1S8CUC0_9GAMM|nr:hypothetical protein BKE30_07275 [Alkanindiges hydrocarboniclasticus]